MRKDLAPNFPLNLTGTYNPTDFTAVFKEESDLDKVPVFNLMALPGVTDAGGWSVAQRFASGS